MEEFSNEEVGALFAAFEWVMDNINHYPGEWTDEEIKVNSGLYSRLHGECKRRRLF